ncbi:class I SAM-dependent methyltransferase [Lacinutrix himadriensis]|uniref:class I SAM-dependent methyltransferase n=1 Tax=Lacinutrix himadriensis TaxID=641549 RepID=UPI0006E1EDCC|nr:class I SAM-dependent methyltransferase [Lacinutrix himadriensis]
MNYLNYIAKSFRINQHPYGKKGTQVLLNHLPKNKIEILEIGCGTGHTASILHAHKNIFKYTGIDVSNEMICACEERKSHLKMENYKFIHHTNKNSYPFKPNSFDVVFCESVIALQDLNSLNIILAEVNKVLKRNGLLILNESLWKEPISSEIINKRNQEILKRYKLIQASNIAKPSTLKNILSKSNLKPIVFKPLRFFINTLDDQQNNNESEKFTRKKIIKSIFNPNLLNSYLYFKYWNFRFRKHGSFIEPYFIVCKKEC